RVSPRPGGRRLRRSDLSRFGVGVSGDRARQAARTPLHFGIRPDHAAGHPVRTPPVACPRKAPYGAQVRLYLLRLERQLFQLRIPQSLRSAEAARIRPFGPRLQTRQERSRAAAARGGTPAWLSAGAKSSRQQLPEIGGRPPQAFVEIDRG